MLTRSRVFFLVVCIPLLRLTCMSQDASADPWTAGTANAQPLTLSATACNIAKKFCVREPPSESGLEKSPPYCLVQLVQELGQMNDRCGTRALILRQELTKMIQAASLEVDGFLSEIDSETGQIHNVRNELADRRDAAVSRSTLASAFGTAG